MSGKLAWLEKLINPAITVAAVILTLVVVESAMRVPALFQAPSTNQHQACCEHDSLLGWRHVPNTVALIRQAEYEVRERFNSRGIRGPEYAEAKPRGEYRIAVIGDSFAEGYTVAFESLFSEVMERELRATCDVPIEVINFGVGGYSTDQELLQFTSVVSGYDPDITILIFHDNDIWYNGTDRYSSWGRGFKPVFTKVDDALELQGVPVPEPVTDAIEPGATAQQPVQPASLWGRAKRMLGDHSYLYREVRSRVKGSQPIYRVAVRMGLAKEPGPGKVGAPIADEFRVYARQHEPDVRRAWRMTEALLARLKAEVEGAGGELAVMHAPARMTVKPEVWAQIMKAYGLQDEWSPNAVSDRLEHVLVQHSIPSISPMAVFRSAEAMLGAKGGSLYFPRDGHWSELGHALTGSMLAAHVSPKCMTSAGTTAP